MEAQASVAPKRHARSARSGLATPMAEMGRRMGQFLWNYFGLLQ
jgi:hypothetical protein